MAKVGPSWISIIGNTVRNGSGFGGMTLALLVEMGRGGDDSQGVSMGLGGDDNPGIGLGLGGDDSQGISLGLGGDDRQGTSLVETDSGMSLDLGAWAKDDCLQWLADDSLAGMPEMSADALLEPQTSPGPEASGPQTSRARIAHVRPVGPRKRRRVKTREVPLPGHQRML